MLGKLYHNNTKSHDMAPIRGQKGVNMNDLFDLVGEYKELFDMLTDDEEVDEQIINDTMEGVMGEIEIKAAGLVGIMNRLDMEIEACDKHKKAWDDRLRVRKNAKERIKTRIMQAMQAMGVNELAAGDVKFKLQNAGGQLPLIVDEDATVPERFTKITIANDNALIRKALEDGEQLDFARFGERSRVLKIK